MQRCNPRASGDGRCGEGRGGEVNDGDSWHDKNVQVCKDAGWDESEEMRW